MKTYLFTYCLVMVMATGLAPLVIAWPGKRRLVDKPDIRKVHQKPIARLGGMALFAAAMLAILSVLWIPIRRAIDSDR